MGGFRAMSALAQVAAPHYQAVAVLVARRIGVGAPTLVQTPTDGLRAAMDADEPAIVFICGLPFVRLERAGVEIVPVAAPVPADEPAGLPIYYADLVTARSAGDLSTAWTLAYNSHDSLSGWLLPRHGLRQAGFDPDAFEWRESGSHARSIELVATGAVDAAAIDSTVLALAARASASAGLRRRLARFGPIPAPPVAIAGGPPGLADAVLAALIALPETEEGRAALALGGVARYAPVSSADYAAVRALDP
jgi:ABC-type phosphate/phosphonate transport system substrate-binding protein